MKKICDFIARWMGVLVLLLVVLALLMPAPFAAIDLWVINPMLGLIMFGMGMTLSPQDFRIVFSRPKDVIIGCAAQFTVMPLLAWVLSWLFDLPPELALGVILVGCCPGGTASNVITYLAKGDLALSVGMTATSTVLAPLMTPPADMAHGRQVCRRRYRGHADVDSLCGDWTCCGRFLDTALYAQVHPLGSCISSCLFFLDDCSFGCYHCRP